MAIKQTAHIIRGLRRDFSDSKQPKEYAIDAKNIRITNREDSSLLSITNEKGTQEIPLNNLSGNYLGHTTINDILVLFTRNKGTDYIYKINLSDKTNITLFEGKLSDESIDHIEALGVYESEDIQKVYWVDGVNQPRMINIKDETKRTNVKEFDFIQELQLKETISVEKSYSSGSFNSGVIQYAFNYYNKNGQESNIVEVTPINYISYEDRGAAPNDYVSNSFKITINNVDTNFDYLRLYSIHRTSIDAIPSVKLVADLKADKDIIEYVDTGIIGETIDPVELLYKGGEYIIPKTLAQKDGTLFFGNIKLKNIKQLKEDTPPTNVFNEAEYPVHYWRNQSAYKFTMTDSTPMFSWKTEKVVGKIDELTGYYPYKAYLSKGDNTTFKSKETYRLGIQFQDNTGKWSDPIVYKDVLVDKAPTINEDNEYLGVQGKLYITNKIVDWAISNNYKKVRPVVVYPQEGERNVIAQGILCPTVFNAKDRHNGICFAQSSWFLRPNAAVGIPPLGESTSKETTNDLWEEDGAYTYFPELGAWPEFRHYHLLPDFFKRNAELQSTLAVTTYGTSNPSIIDSKYLENGLPYGVYTKTYLDRASELFKDSFYIDQSIITFHSPEIELQKISNVKDAKLRIIGYSEFDANAGDIDITLQSDGIDETLLTSLYTGVTVESEHNKVSRSLISGLFYLDRGAPNNIALYTSKVSSMVYPWNSQTSLNSFYTKDYESTGYEYGGVLKNKKISNLKFSKNSSYLSDSVFNIKGNIEIFDGINNLNIPTPDNVILGTWSPYSSGILYKGNIDTIIVPDFSDIDFKSVNKEDLKFNFKDGRPRASSPAVPLGSASLVEKAFFNADIETNEEVNTFIKEPISIKYKSTPHGVIFIDYNSNNQVILPSIYNDSTISGSYTSYGGILFRGIQPVEASTEDGTSPALSMNKNYLWLAELYREEVPNKFGGDNYESSIWYPAGKSVKLHQESSDGIHYNICVEFTQGDTFYSRFDSLKTYPYTLEDVNSIVEIGSFMVETRINLDARYDRNRGQQSNLVMNPGNFNLFNDVYNQKNNFFNYRIIDKDIADNTKFPNTIVWSKQKFAEADVDAWTNINMASSLDLDGTKGELTKLVSFKNEIFSFQPEAINHILFNSRVQIPTSDGVPIELTNAYKVDGARQLSSVGSSNTLAIKSTDRGIYYMDNITKGIYVFNGQQSESLSDKLGMSSWVKEQDINSYKVNYDKINQDIYFINNDNCLSYSEKLGEFESFFDYNNSEIFNVKDGTYAIKSNKLYKLFEGNYNRFFEYGGKPFWVTFTHNENPFNDKIYNTLEFRADTYEYNTKEDENGDIVTYCELSNNSSFNTIKVDNEYQDTEEVSLEFNRFTPSNLKRKFRIWRANIPRDSVNKRDRIRNTWANITLKASNPSNTKTELHDLVVSYFM